jgi:hypothetical protein
MASGGRRFTPSERPRAAPRVIDVEARPRHETLYDVLVVSPAASSRKIRKIARALRRNHPDASSLHDVCLAEQVLGRADLRAEYDALLARLRAAKLPMPKIGVAIEGERLGPGFAEHLADTGRAAGKVFKVLLQVALVLAVLVVIATVFPSKTNKYDRYNIKLPDFKPIQIPRFDPKLFEYDPSKYRVPDFKPIDIPRIDLKQLEREYRRPELDRPRIDPPRLDPPKLDRLKRDPPKLDRPKYEPAVPRIELPTPPELETIDVPPPPSLPPPSP